VSPLEGWGNLYAVTGDAGGTLAALTFAVVTFARRDAAGALDWVVEYGTSTVVQFSTVLFVSAILSAPWQAHWPVGLLLGLVGLPCLAYAGVVARRLENSTDYRPTWEDRLCYAALPLAANALLVAAGLLLAIGNSAGPYTAAAATLLLLATGIGTAWDAVTFIATGHGEAPEQDASRQSANRRRGRR
jgi:hypothetical protein